MKNFSNEYRLEHLKARKSILLAHGETMNYNLLRKINRQIRHIKESE